MRATARRLPFGPRTFDAVIAVEVFEHLDSRSRDLVLDEARRVLRHGGVLAIVDKNIAALERAAALAAQPLVKRIDECRGRWMYPARGSVRERWFWPSGFQAELGRRFKDVRIVRLLSQAEERAWLFRRLPAARLMTLWSARVPGGRP